jgi:hypothetical protein
MMKLSVVFEGQEAKDLQEKMVKEEFQGSVSHLGVTGDPSAENDQQ